MLTRNTCVAENIPSDPALLFSIKRFIFRILLVQCECNFRTERAIGIKLRTHSGACIDNNRCACAAGVTVLCLCVLPSVCLSFSATTQQGGQEVIPMGSALHWLDVRNCDLVKILHSKVMALKNMSEKANMSFSSPSMAFAHFREQRSMATT